MNYVIITPVKNEEKYIAETIESVLSQTVRPSLWLIVDDSSTDGTRAIIEKYAAENSFINLLRRESNTSRDAGYGGIRAFNFAAQKIDPEKYDYIVNLDGDVSFEPNYFERLFEKFSEIPKLGITGGRCWSYHFGRLVPERMPESHVSGATKIYRRECYLDIQPIRELPAWDTVDELIAQRLGWITLSFQDIKLIHLKPMAVGSGNSLKGRFVQGKVSYRIGYPLDFIVFRSIKMAAESPYLIGGLLLVLGFLTALLSNDEVMLEKDLVKYFRQKQRARIYKIPAILNKLSNK